MWRRHRREAVQSHFSRLEEGKEEQRMDSGAIVGVHVENRVTRPGLDLGAIGRGGLRMNPSFLT